MSEIDWGPLAVNLVGTAVAVTAVMLVTFAIGSRLRRHSIIDIVWGIGFTVVAPSHFFSVHSAFKIRLTDQAICGSATIARGLPQRQGYSTSVQNGDFVPWLAESWKVEDSATWVFNLRRNVKWHDGSPFTSADWAALRSARISEAMSALL